jgi:RNA polymerase sigma-70 factor (ECF subfamily)
LRNVAVKRSDLSSEDSDLVKDCLSGSATAWKELYGRFFPLIAKAVSMYSRQTEIEDTIQNVFVNLLSALSKYDDQFPLSKFIWTVAHRTCVDDFRVSHALKRSSLQVTYSHNDSSDENEIVIADRSPCPEESLSGNQTKHLLSKALHNLNDKCREILNLRYLQEMSFKEISQQVGTGEKVLAVQAGRCLDALRAIYKKSIGKEL